MPGIVDLFRLLSLDVTRGLVNDQNLGLGFATVGGGAGSRFTRTGSPAPLAIADASNTTPIILTTAQPHGIGPTRKTTWPNELHAVVSGVLGNTAANVVDANPRSRTKGQHLGVQLIPTGASTLAMYAPSYTTGLLTAVAGNGAYTGGGTITPALTAGQILVGREHTRFENSPAGAPPFMAVVPVGNEFVAPGDRRVGHGAVGITAEARDELKYRAIGQDKLIVEVHSWGAANPADPLQDFDVVQRLYQQFLQSMHLLGVGSFIDRAGVFSDQAPKETQLVKLGHYHVATLAISTPLLEFGMPFVPTPITISSQTFTQLDDGSSAEMGCSQ
jgi:hypothetical protein